MDSNQLIDYLEKQIKEIVERYKEFEQKNFYLHKENEELKNKLSILENKVTLSDFKKTNDCNNEIERLKQKHKHVKTELIQIKRSLDEMISQELNESYNNGK